VPWVPIFVNAELMNVLILGGGEEGFKKARKFARAGARVTVYSLSFVEKFEELAQLSVRLVQGDVRDFERLRPYLEESDLIILTIPDSDIGVRLREWARENHRIFVDSTDFNNTLAAVGHDVEVNGFKIGVFSYARSSLVSMEAAERVRKCLEKERDLWVLLNALGHAKRLMKSMRIDVKNRIKVHRELFRDPELRSIAEQGRLEEAISYVERRIKELTKG